MIREERQLLAELARVNSDVAPLALRIMDGSASTEEQRDLGERLSDVGQRLRERAGRDDAVVEGQLVTGLAGPRRGVSNHEP
jgi:hypothetical protein